MPDTPDVRSAGVWYANYSLAERVYNVAGVDSITDTRISRYFEAIVGLRPGPETGVSSLAGGWWRQTFGYDLMQISGEIYTRGTGSPNRSLGIVVGNLDPLTITQALTTTGYTETVVGAETVFTPAVPSTDMPRAAMNAVVPGHDRLVAGADLDDVITATLRMKDGSRTLGRDQGFRALASNLGTVDAAFLAADVPPPPFQPPPHGHLGHRLHSFYLYGLAYQEPRPGQRYFEIALSYRSQSDARADVSTLRTRLQRESLAAFGDSWSHLTSIAGVSAHGTVLLARLKLREDVPPTLWLDAMAEGDLTVLSP